jgi:hypothetical protein
MVYSSVVCLNPIARVAPMSDVTGILSAIEAGDPHAAEQLLPLVYDELRQRAAAKLAREKPGPTLQPTALVHEAYRRLVAGGQSHQGLTVPVAEFLHFRMGGTCPAAEHEMKRITARRKNCEPAPASPFSGQPHRGGPVSPFSPVPAHSARRQRVHLYPAPWASAGWRALLPLSDLVAVGVETKQ